MADDNDEEKPHDPTEKKLRDARQKGDVARSQEISTALSYGGLLIGLTLFGALALTEIGAAGRFLLDVRLVDGVHGEDSLRSVPVDRALGRVIGVLLPLFLIPMVLVLAGTVLQGGIVFSGEKLQPKHSRLSILKNAGQKFGRKGLFEFSKSFVKLTMVSGVLTVFGFTYFGDIIRSLYLSPFQTVGLMADLSVDFLLAVFLLALAVGAVDLMWQRSEFIRRNRMSQREVKEEIKSSEGDPMMKGQRRQRGHEIVSSSVREAVEAASVLLVNPEHYAVALKWDRTAAGAPICTAKGVDEVALRMREIAAEARIPIHRDPPTARAIHATTPVGDEIAPDLYAPVAAAIRFADALRARQKALGL